MEMPTAENPVVVHQGDCLDLLRRLPDGCVDAVITDPPYGVGYEAGGKPAGPATRTLGHVAWDSIIGDDEVRTEWLTEAFRVLRPGSALYLCCRWDVEPEWRAGLVAAGFTVKQRLTWHKRVGGKGDLTGTYAPTVEDVLFATKGRHELNHRPPSLLDVGCVPTWEFRYHPHQKPVELPALLIKASTQPGDVVLDPFAGSGTTGLACLRWDRRFIGCELDPTHYATAVRRLDHASGTGKGSLFAGATN